MPEVSEEPTLEEEKYDEYQEKTTTELPKVSEELPQDGYGYDEQVDDDYEDYFKVRFWKKYFLF